MENKRGYSSLDSIQSFLDYRLPKIKNKKLIDPHVVIIGAGASKAACPIDKNGKSVPLLKNILEVLDLENLLNKYGFSSNDIDDFEKFYSEICEIEQYQELCQNLEEAVYEYFSKLELPDSINLYDYLILSLTEKDLIISFNWDPFLLQAYRRNIKVGNLPQLVFPHGNVGVGVCNHCKQKGYYGYICPKCYLPFEKMPLLYPTGKKDYETKPIIRNEWLVAQDFLKRAAGLTIFGYGAPVSDISAIKLLKEAFSISNTKEICPVTIVNLLSVKDEQLDKWNAFYDKSMICYVEKFQDTILWQNPRVSLETLFDAILQQHPREKTKSFNEFHSLVDLQNFVSTITEYSKTDAE